MKLPDMRLFTLCLFLFVTAYLVAQPINDDCDAAIDLGDAPVCLDDIYTNLDATASSVFSNPAFNTPTCWTSVETDVWLLFYPPTDGSVIDFLITVTGTDQGPNNIPLFQPSLAIYRGECGLDELDELACVNAGAGQSAVSISILGLDPGLPYFLRVQDFSATAAPNWGDFQVCIDSLSTYVEITASADSICIGESVQLSASGSDTFDSFSWAPSQTLNNPNSLDPVATPFQTTTYEITALDEGDNLITNGDFESGNVGFTSDYIFGPDSLPIGPPINDLFEGGYIVSNDPSMTHAGFAPCPDHTSGSGNMLVVNGTTIADETIWCQTVSVQANTDYLFSAWVTSVTFNNPAVLQFSIDGNLLGNPFNAPFGTCNWTEFSSTWNSGINTSVEICITNQNTGQSGNDFALDDINFRSFTEATDEVTIHVSDPTISLDQLGDATCTGICDGSISISASGGFVSNNYSFEWNTNETTPAISDLCAGDYIVQITDDLGCTDIQNFEVQEAIFSVLAISLVSPCEVTTIGSAQAIVSGGALPFTYEWDNGEMTEIASNLMDGIHEVTVVDANGCTASGSVEIVTNPNGLDFPINVVEDSICVGTSVVLSTNPGDPDTEFEWSTGETGVNSITVAPTTTTTYSLTVNKPGADLIVNGDFEGGDVGFTSEYVLGFGGTWGPLSFEGTYIVIDNTNAAHSNFASCQDHTTGTGQMLVVNGSVVPNESIWCQEVTVSPNTDYQFSTWVMTAISENPATLQFSINGELLGNPFNAPFQTCDWVQFFEVWNSGLSTSAEICIVNQNTGGSGNDFALDDISLVPLCTTISEQTITVSNLEAQLTNITDIDCSGNGGAVEVVADQGIEPYTFNWSNGATGQNATYVEGGNYEVSVTDDLGCEEVISFTIQEEDFVIDSVSSTPITCGEGTGGDVIVVVPGSITVDVSQGTAPYQYSFDNGISFSSDNTSEAPDPGTYLIFVQDAAGCEAMAEVTIADLVFPEVSILSPDGTSFCVDLPALELLAEISGEYTALEWSTTETTESILVDLPGTYSITVENDQNCPETVEILITECGAYELPNIFTPNGDDINDTFGLLSEGNVQIVEFVIYNRWGQLVHEQVIPWDGNFNGEQHPSDVLAYRMVVSGPEGTEVLSGEVTLVR